MRVGVLYGGWSSEREVSLASGQAVADSLRQAGFKVLPLVLDAGDRDERKLAARLKGARLDAAFIALHGGYGENGGIQALLEKLDIPSTGSGSLACGLAMHKGCAKLIFEAAGIPTAPWQALHRPEFTPASLKTLPLSLPLVVKPADSGSAIGVTIVRKKSGLAPAIRKAFKESDWVLVEKFIPGVEVTVGVLAGRALPVIEIVPANDFYDYDAKYTPGRSTHLIPARVPEAKGREARQMALKAFKALGCEDYARVDFIVPPAGRPRILEVNTVPGFTAVSLFPEAARAAGIPMPALVKQLVLTAVRRMRVQGLKRKRTKAA